MSIRLVVFVVFALGALSGACSKKDCRAYADHMAKFASPDRTASVRFVAMQSCEKGRVTEAQIKCTLGTRDSSAAYACHK